MIPKADIQKNLAELQMRFLATRKRKEHLYFSKLAVMELCGWIEVSVDDILIRLSRKRLSVPADQQEFNRLLRRNSGFTYERHLRWLLIQLAGMVTVEKIEAGMHPQSLADLRVECENLTTARNSLAHTYMKGTQYQIDAPSLTIGRFNTIHPALGAFEKAVFKFVR